MRQQVHGEREAVDRVAEAQQVAPASGVWAPRDQAGDVVLPCNPRCERHREFFVEIHAETAAGLQVAQQAGRRVDAPACGPDSRRLEQPRDGRGVQTQQAGIDEHSAHRVHRVMGVGGRFVWLLQEIGDVGDTGMHRRGLRHVHSVVRAPGERADISHAGHAGPAEVHGLRVEGQQHVADRDEHVAAGRRGQFREIGEQQVEERHALVVLRRGGQGNEDLALGRVGRGAAAVASGMADQDTESREQPGDGRRRRRRAGAEPFRGEIPERVQCGAERAHASAAGIGQDVHVCGGVQQAPVAAPAHLPLVPARLGGVGGRQHDVVELRHRLAELLDPRG